MRSKKKPTYQTVPIVFPDGSMIPAQVADTPEKLGFRYRKHPAADQGMLFIFQKWGNRGNKR